MEMQINKILKKSANQLDEQGLLASRVINNTATESALYYHPEADARHVYRELGSKRLLAPHWPIEFGGQGKSFSSTVQIAELLSDNKISDFLYYLSIFFVGELILKYGNETLKHDVLPKLASGQRFCCVLYTEPDSGSDLASIQSRAFYDQESYTLYGEKVFALKVSQADYALCVAKTDANEKIYQNISLFLIDLHGQNIKTTLLKTTMKDKFHHVLLNGVKIPKNNLIGEENQGWSVINHALILERIGLDYFLKAKRALLFLLNYTLDKHVLRLLLSKFEVVKTLVDEVIIKLDSHEELPQQELAIVKYITSELAKETGILVMNYAHQNASLLDQAARKEYEAIITEAPSTTISGGTSEMMLEIIASTYL